MAKVFENQSTDYDGNPDDVQSGSDTLSVYFSLSHDSSAVLTLLVRKTGTTDPFIAIRREAKSTAFKFDANGWDYYFKLSVLPGDKPISATLDA